MLHAVPQKQVDETERHGWPVSCDQWVTHLDQDGTIHNMAD